MGRKRSGGENSDRERPDKQRPPDGRSDNERTEQEIAEQAAIDLLDGPSILDLDDENREDRVEEIERAIQIIHDVQGAGIRGIVRKRFPFLPPEDLDDAWVRALAEVFLKATLGTIKVEGSLFALVTKIMLRRCADVVRSRARERHRIEQYLKSVKPVADETLASQEQIAVIYGLLDEAIKKLPPVQGDVWRANRELGYKATLAELKTYLDKWYSRPQGWTLCSVRRAREEGRKKIIKYLEEFGYHDGC